MRMKSSIYPKIDRKRGLTGSFVASYLDLIVISDTFFYR